MSTSRTQVASLLAVLGLGLGAAMPAAGQSCPYPNLLQNPGFEECPWTHDVCGFVTQYLEWPVGAPGAFSVRSDPQGWNPLLIACQDHTPNGTRMMVVDGAKDIIVWGQKVSGLQPNTWYRFKFWWINLHPARPPQYLIRFQPDANIWAYQDRFVNPQWGADGVWRDSKFTWYSGPYTVLNLLLIDLNNYQDGNDFAIDDLEFSLSPEPVIVTNPQSTNECIGGSASFTVSASGCPQLTYQWRRNGSPIAGANANSLLISPLSPADAASYDCVVSNSEGSATSAPATLDVHVSHSDFNGDGFVDGIDYDLFNNLFEAGDPGADYNGDGFVDGIDADQFNADFEKGCP